MGARSRSERGGAGAAHAQGRAGARARGVGRAADEQHGAPAGAGGRLVGVVAGGAAADQARAAGGGEGGGGGDAGLGAAAGRVADEPGAGVQGRGVFVCAVDVPALRLRRLEAGRAGVAGAEEGGGGPVCGVRDGGIRLGGAGERGGDGGGALLQLAGDAAAQVERRRRRGHRVDAVAGAEAADAAAELRAAHRRGQLAAAGPAAVERREEAGSPRPGTRSASARTRPSPRRTRASRPSTRPSRAARPPRSRRWPRCRRRRRRTRRRWWW